MGKGSRTRPRLTRSEPTPWSEREGEYMRYRTRLYLRREGGEKDKDNGADDARQATGLVRRMRKKNTKPNWQVQVKASLD